MSGKKTFMFRFGGWAAALFLPVVLFVWAGCGRWPGRAPALRLERIPIAILMPSMSTGDFEEGMHIIKRMFPSAVAIQPAELADEMERLLAEHRILLIPAVSHCPVEVWMSLEMYLDRGGPAVFIGMNPFEQRVGLAEDGRPRTHIDFVNQLIDRARTVEGFSGVQAWQHLNNWDEIKGRVRLAQPPLSGWFGLTVEVEDFDEWDALVLDEVPVARFGEGENTMVFFARGGPRTVRLVVECEERDGSRWFHEVPLERNWAPFALREEAFRYFRGGTGRGLSGDRLSFSRITRISAGLSAHLAPPSPGEHRFDLSDIRMARDSRPPLHAAAWPDVPLVSPPFRRYDLQALKIRSSAASRDYVIEGGIPAQSPLPRERGMGGETESGARWIPLFSAHGEKGELLGWPASLYCEPRTHAPMRHWAWIAVNPSQASRTVFAAMIEEAVRRLHAGVFLQKAGSETFVFKSGEPILVTACCASRAPLPSGVRISAELQREGERFPGRRVLNPCLADQKTEFHLGIAPRTLRRAERAVIRVRLEDPAARVEYDMLEQPVLFLPDTETPLDADWLTTVGSHFAFRGRRLFLLGVNYWPFSANGRMPGESNPHWLEPSAFDPDLVVRDLDVMAEAGVNVVSIQYLNSRQAPQLQFFVNETKKRNMWVHLFIAHLQPLDQDMEKARELFMAADLARMPGVFAIDVAWEPHLGRESERRRLDSAWRGWIIEQYGSVAHAEQVIGMSFWRVNGEVTGPPDEHLVGDGPHRTAVAVYRRFVDDYMSRQYGYVARQLRGWGARQLLSARTGFGGTGNAWADPFFPMDPVAGAAHFDFISPEGWGLHGAREQFLSAGFITAYCRGVAGGKPVMWLEFGSSVGLRPKAQDLENQARVYGEVFEMVLRSRGAAALGWWYPGGYRVEEGSDMGIVNPDGSWRPVGNAYRSFGNRMRRETLRPEPWRGREVNRDADARGLSALWEKWKKTYAQEMGSGGAEEVRLQGFGKRSGEIPLSSVGGVPFMDPAPMESLNAEWGTLLLNDAPIDRMPGQGIEVSRSSRLRLEIINTGPSTWDASQEGRPRTVWISFVHETGRRMILPVPPVAFGAKASVSWLATDTGAWVARPWLDGIGAFGEPLQINVRP